MSLGRKLDELIEEHGLDVVADALAFLPRLIALIKKGKLRRITVALDQAHAEVDAMAEDAKRRARADEPTRPMPLDPDRNGQGHV